MLEAYKEDTESLSAMGDLQEFDKKFNFLKKKWASGTIEDTHASRLMAPILKFKTHPIIVAIISDNLTYFKEHYQDAHYQKINKDLILLLERACLSGSKKIAGFLLEQLKIDIASGEYSHLLGYISASQNVEWTKEVAIAIAKKGQDVPLSVYGNGTPKILDIIEGIFEKERGHKKQRIF